MFISRERRPSEGSQTVSGVTGLDETIHKAVYLPRQERMRYIYRFYCAQVYRIVAKLSENQRLRLLRKLGVVVI